MDALLHLNKTPKRTVAGVMTGTSLDGVDAAIAQLQGRGTALEMEVLSFLHQPYPEALRDLLLRNTDPNTSSVADLTALNVRLCSVYAEAVGQALEAAGREQSDLDLVGSHGQTMCHRPEPTVCAGASVRATLQIGDPSTLAQRLGTVVVGQFRMADMAWGGQGAPLVPYMDHAVFSDSGETRLLLNLGGIANATLLPAGASVNDIRAFDTGPANMVLDALARHFFDTPYDPNGQHAAAGTPDHDLLTDLLQGAYFQQPPPKSTGRGQFGHAYVRQMRIDARRRNLSPQDTMATATLLTAASVYQAYARFLRPVQAVDTVIASGGGVHNSTLIAMLRDAFAPIPVRTTAAYGMDPDAKEALCFAVLAHEAINGMPTNVPPVTGASRSVPLGTIAMPG
jgi:anhydro-N-acetylmuramic acid kinase